MLTVKNNTYLPSTVGMYSNASLVERPRAVGRPRYFSANASFSIYITSFTSSLASFWQLELQKWQIYLCLPTVQSQHYRFSKLPGVDQPLFTTLQKRQCSHPRTASAKTRGHEYQHVLHMIDALAQSTLGDRINLLNKAKINKARSGHLVEYPLLV
jgi:hypothetical protein